MTQQPPPQQRGRTRRRSTLRRKLAKLLDTVKYFFLAIWWDLEKLVRHVRRRVSRNWRHWLWNLRHFRFWPAAPAIFVICTWLVFGAYLMAWSPFEMRARYWEIARASFIESDYKTARIASERLLQLSGKNRQQSLYLLGISLIGQGRAEEGLGLIETLAPLDLPGYAPAQVYLAQQLLTGATVTPADIQTAEIRLQAAVAAEPGNGGAHHMLGQIYYQRANWPLAKRHFQQAVSANKESALWLARIGSAQKDEAFARRWATEAERHYRAFAESRTNDPAPRLSWAEAVLLMGEYQRAVDILVDGLRKQDEPAFRQALGNVCAAWSQALGAQKPADLAKQLQVVQLGLINAPQNDALIRKLLALSRVDAPEGGQARATLTKQLADGKASIVLHFILGVDAWTRGEADKARQHLEVAFELAPQMPYVGNNLALVLALSPQPDLPRAMGIIQAVLDHYPNNPHFRETRGQILVKLGRWKEAVVDLEHALLTIPSNPTTHQALAQAYQNLGLTDLAKEHQRRASEPKAGVTKTGAGR